MENKRFLKKFNSQNDYESQKDSVMEMTHVVLLEDTNEIIFASKSETPNDPFNGHEYVDLGLPSGTLWATKSIGAEIEEGYGLYFAWGSTVGYTSEQISEGTFIFGTSADGLGSGVKYMEDEFTPTKYNATDGKTVLDLEDDAAHVVMGGDWHMPTKEQLNELTVYTTSTWTTQNGVNGRLFTSTNNGNSLFVPASGHAYQGGISNDGSNGCICSNSVDVPQFSSSCDLDFTSSEIKMDKKHRSFGHVIFGVVG
jgi:hypothetical protein